MRVLVTGSRAWDDQNRIWDDLDALYCQNPEIMDDGDCLTVVEGACPSGADTMAHLWVLDATLDGLRVHSERHPADWKTHNPDCKPYCINRGYCMQAGFRRNKEMVDLGADLVLAYIKNDSNGTMNTVKHAQAAGIPVRIVKDEDE